MRGFILALAALAAMSCNRDNPKDLDATNDAAAIRGAAISASQGSTPEFPSLESDLYCARFAAGAGTPDVEKSCKEQETVARKEAMAMTAPATTLSYCAKTAEAAGGSYQILKLCIEREQANDDTP